MFFENFRKVFQWVLDTFRCQVKQVWEVKRHFREFSQHLLTFSVPSYWPPECLEHSLNWHINAYERHILPYHSIVQVALWTNNSILPVIKLNHVKPIVSYPSFSSISFSFVRYAEQSLQCNHSRRWKIFKKHHFFRLPEFVLNL